MKPKHLSHGLVVAMLMFYTLCTAANGQDRKTVEITAELVAIKDQQGQYQLRVDFDIEKGWHIYGQAETDNPSIQTSIEMQLPQGVEKVKTWVTPKGKIKADRSVIYEGKFAFEHTLVIKSGAKDRKIALAVEYQVCDEKRCKPPTSKEISVMVPAVAKTAAKPKRPVFENERFEAPVRLQVNDQPLNRAARQMYPSPAMYDVDHDGQDELIVGDIFGSLNVYENKNAGKKMAPEWESHVGLKTADGKKIKVSNW